jgi:transformation/transcription domain-associated protein
MFILVSVTGEISSGAINVAEDNLEYLIKLYSQKLNPVDVDESLIDIQQKAIYELIRELIKQVCLFLF